MKTRRPGTPKNGEKYKKRKESLNKFHTEVEKKARENEQRAAKSLEYARHTIVS